MAYIGQAPFQEFTSVPTKDNFTGDGSTTAFDLSAAVPVGSENALEVFVNNVRQEPGSGKAFTLGQDGNGDYKRITFASAPTDTHAIYVINDRTSFTSIAPLPQDLNGSELILDADADTTITADTDDQIDIKISGADDFRFTANTFTALAGSGVVIPDSGLTLGSTAVTSTAAELNLLDGVSGLVQADLTKLAAVDSTAAELNIMDGGTSATGTTLATADRVVVNDAGTMKQVALSDFETFMESNLDTLSSVTTVGALNAGSITSGFTSIDVGAGAITTTGLISGGSLDIDDVLINGSTIGHTDDSDLMTVADGILTVAGEVSLTTLDIGGTNVTATAAEINLIDGGTSRGTDAVASGDGLLVNDAGTMKMTNVDTVSTYFASHNVGGGNIVTTGALNSGTITSGFGTIDTGSSTITTTGAITGGSLTADDVAINGKVITMTGSAGDTFTTTVATNGATTLTTVDTAAAAANITITADGTAELAGTTVTLNSAGGVTLDADNGTITFADAGSSLGTITSSGYSGTAAAATTVTITDNESTDEGNAIVFVAGADTDGGTGLGLESDGHLTYNPSSGTLTCTNLVTSGTHTVTDSVTMTASNAVVFEGSTADAYETTLTSIDTTSSDKTISLPNVSGTLPVLAAVSTTQITSTPEELNLIDGGTARGTTSVASGDGLLVNDGGTMRMTNVDTVSTYFASHNVGGGNIVTTGALDSGSITSGFGAIDNGTSNIRSATITAETAFVPDASGGADLGTTSLEFNDLFLNDSGSIQFGDDQDTTLVHTDGTGLTLNSTNKLCFNDASQFIQGSSATVLSIGATDEIDLTATTVDLNGTLNVSGVATFQAVPVLPANSIDSAHYVDGSIDNAHIADDQIDSEHYADGSIDTAHIGDLQVTGGKLALDHRSAGATDDVKTGNQNDYLFFDADVGISFFTANAEDMRLEDDGDLHVDNDVIAFSTTISDATLKYNINPVEFALDKIKQLKGVTFNYFKNDKESAGLLAQDVEKVLPSAVSEKKLPLHTGDDKSYKTLHYDSVTAILVEAIKELTAKVEKLENK